MFLINIHACFASKLSFKSVQVLTRIQTTLCVELDDVHNPKKDTDEAHNSVAIKRENSAVNTEHIPAKAHAQGLDA